LISESHNKSSYDTHRSEHKNDRITVHRTNIQKLFKKKDNSAFIKTTMGFRETPQLLPETPKKVEKNE